MLKLSVLVGYKVILKVLKLIEKIVFVVFRNDI